MVTSVKCSCGGKVYSVTTCKTCGDDSCVLCADFHNNKECIKDG